MKYIPLLFLSLLLAAPFGASASTPRPSCEFTVTTANGEVSFSKSGKVLVGENEPFTLAWESDNATKARDENGDDTSLSGSRTFSIDENASYSYVFSAGSKKATCKVSATVADGAFTASSLTSESTKPTLSGTVSGTKMVRVVVSDTENEKVLFTSKNIRVKAGKWEVRLTKALSKGAYTVTLYGDKAFKLNELASGTLGIGVPGSVGSSSGSSTATISASSLPLLTGGTIGPSGSVPVAYLKLANTSSVPASVAGVWLKQNGSAPVSNIIGFTTVDDKGMNRTTLGGSEGTALFKNGSAFVPLMNATLAPRQIRIFTIKAQLSRNVSAGSSVMLDATFLDTAAKINAQFPIRGTTWTLRAY